MQIRATRRTVGVASAVLVLIGGAVYACIADQIQAQGSGGVASGSISVQSVTVSSPMVLDVPQQVTMRLVATGQVLRVQHVKVEPGRNWPTETCGDSSYFTGVEADLPVAVDVSPGEPLYLDDTNAPNIMVTFGNSPDTNQTNCAFPMKVTVS